MKRKPKKRARKSVKPRVIDNSPKAKLARDIAYLERLILISEDNENEALSKNNETLAKLFSAQVTKLVVQLQELKQKAI